MVLAKPENKHVLKAFDLTGKVAAVTGGARGIGLEVSRGLAEAGADIALIYSTSKDAAATAEEIAKANRVKAAAYQSDVKDAGKIEATLQQIAKDFGKLDIVIANAGIASHHAAEDYTVDQWKEIMDVNLNGAFYTAQAAGRIFKSQGFGNLIFTASVSGILVNIPQKQAAYNASKSAVIHLCKSLAVEWVDFARVRDMLDVHPEEWRKKWFQLIPAQRMADAYELKGAFVFLASDASSYVSGANVVADGCYTLP